MVKENPEWPVEKNNNAFGLYRGENAEESTPDIPPESAANDNVDLETYWAGRNLAARFSARVAA